MIDPETAKKVRQLRRWAIRFEIVARQLAPRAAYARDSDAVIVLRPGWQKTFRKLESRCVDAYGLWQKAQECSNLAEHLERSRGELLDRHHRA